MLRKHVNCERKLMDTEHSLRSCVLAGGVSMCIHSKGTLGLLLFMVLLVKKCSLFKLGNIQNSRVFCWDLPPLKKRELRLLLEGWNPGSDNWLTCGAHSHSTVTFIPFWSLNGPVVIIFILFCRKHQSLCAFYVEKLKTSCRPVQGLVRLLSSVSGRTWRGKTVKHTPWFLRQSHSSRGWPGTEVVLCLSVLSAGITGVCHHAQPWTALSSDLANLLFAKEMRIQALYGTLSQVSPPLEATA